MRKYCCIPVLTCLGLTVSVGSPSASAQVISQGFDNVVALDGAGWARINNSTSPNTAVTWFQGSTAAFVAQAGAPNAYAASNYQCISAGTGTQNTWLLTPAVTLQNGMVLKFWTRNPSTTFPDRMQVRMSLAGGSSNIGTIGDPNSVGAFTTMLLEINPTQLGVGGYPTAWTEFTVPISGVGAPTSGRLAFRYFVTGGGPTGTSGNYIGVDTVTLSGPPSCADPLHACPADVAASSGVPGTNGTVDIDDLVLVITTWGQNNTSAGGPHPAADCAPGPNGDCQVNIDDLVKVITSWGDCEGACCLANGSCVNGQSSSECTTAGGTYQGHDTNCVNIVCPIPPPNDLCANRQIVGNGATPFNNANANTDGPTVPNSCLTVDNSPVTRDVWFNYTATCTGHVTFDTLATAPPFDDTVIQVFNGNACPPGALLGCNDDVDSANLLSTVTVDLTTGQVVKVRVASWSTDSANQGPGVLTIACASINDDNCIDATLVATPASPLPTATVVNGTLNNATQDTAPVCNGVPAGLGRWYRVVGNGKTLTACLCDSPDAAFDGRLSVYCGSDCGDLVCVAASGADNCDGALNCLGGSGANNAVTMEFVSWCAANNQTYWILVHTDNLVDPPGNNYVLKISTSAANCTPTVQCYIPGNECSTAGEMPALIVGTNNGTNVNMTASPEQETCVAAGEFNADVWHNFTAPTTNTYTLTLCNPPTTSPTSWDSMLAIYSGSCGSLAQLACNDDGCGGSPNRSVISIPLNGGQQYKVRVGTWGTGTVAGVAWQLIISNPAGCGTCTGTAETAPACQADGTAASADPNGGCAVTSFPFPQTVTLGQTICGQGNYYTTGGSGFRDTDWYLFTPASSGVYRLSVCSAFPSSVGFMRNLGSSVATCAQCSNALNGLVNANALTPTDVDRNLDSGVTYAIFVAPQQGLVVPPACSDYRFSVTALAACPAWSCPASFGTLDTACHSAPPAPDPDNGCAITPTAFNPITVGGPAVCGILSTFISGVNCGREFDWYQFVAPSTGNYTVTVNSETGVVCQMITGTNVSGTPCGTTAVVAGSTFTTTRCGQFTSGPIALTSGVRYAFLVGQASFYGLPCNPGNVGNRYWVTVTTP